MKIRELKVIVSSPGRNFVTVKILTDEGVYGVGDATLNGRELAVAELLTEYIAPILIGQDPDRIEDIWQYLFRGVYWRGGPVFMTGLAGVDMALWDIKGKVAGLPVYSLLGGKTRDKLLVYRAILGTSKERILENCYRIIDEEKTKVLKLAPNPGAEEKVLWDPPTYLREVPKICAYLREKLGEDIQLIYDGHGRLTPIQAAQLARDLEKFGLFFYEDPIRREYIDSLRLVREKTSTPIAVGEMYFHKWECLPLITGQLIDYLRVDICHIGGITEAKKLSVICEPYHIQMAFHGPSDISPVSYSANAHVDISIPNFGVQELPERFVFDERVQEVFPGGTICDQNGYLRPPDKPGLGVDIDEKEASRYPYKRSYLPTARGADGSVQDW